jgi:predicted nucleic acid-binding protein
MSGHDVVPLLAWDSCTFLAWFNDEEDKPLAVIDYLLRQIADGKASLLISAISCVEVLDQAGTSDAGTKFKQFAIRPNVIRASADWRIAEKAAEIRQKVTAEVAAGRMARGVKAPDALIVATAVVYRATELHTFDPVLLGLDGSPLVDFLTIAQPRSPHGQRLLGER